MGGGKKGRAWKRLSNERWKEAWNEYFGPHVQKDQIKEGLRFCFYTGDFGLDRIWFEVVEMTWDWRYQEELALLWREDDESFEYWSQDQICRCGHIVNEEEE